MATTENVLDYMKRVQDPVITSTELADHFDISQQRAYEKLSELAGSGEIEKKKVGARGAVWFIDADYSLANVSIT